MSEKAKFLMTFRARLMLLLTSFLILTIALVVLLDNWARKRIDQEIERQSKQVTQAVNNLIADFAQAINLAQQNLDKDEFLYEIIKPEQLPPAVQHIFVTDKDGKVKDSTLPDQVNRYISVPAEAVAQERLGDPAQGDAGVHGDQIKTYDFPLRTTGGLHWIVIVMSQQATINQIGAAQEALADRNRELSNYRLATTAGLLMLALAIAVVIGWRFTRPIKQLAASARRVAAGELDFKVNVSRPLDEVGQLATTFNEMIEGLKYKRELEEKLNHAERSAVIGRLTQSVAHEIRNPLNVINLSIDHVSTRYAPDDASRREQFTRILTSIKDEIRRLKHMVNDLLNYGRPARLDLETIDMRELVNDTISLVRPQADEQGVEVSIEMGEAPAEVRGDRERLKSCLSNIAINALQAMPAGGHLTTRVEKNDGTVEVSITDTGVGIGEEAIVKVFEPYFSTKKTGFGLGLAVTKKIIDEHKGAIEVRSELNRGTTFTVKLPAGDE